MHRGGSVTLSDVRSRTLAIVCESCGRRGRRGVARQIAVHGDVKLTDLLVTLADCPKARSFSVRARCKSSRRDAATRAGNESV
jgi:hypothetical protein